jgi:hypothetical protein
LPAGQVSLIRFSPSWICSGDFDLAAVREDMIGEALLQVLWERLRLVVVDEESDARAIFPPRQDVIADRLAPYAIDPKGRNDMLGQAPILAPLADDFGEGIRRR